MSGAVVRTDANRTLLAALLATVAMLFTAFAAAYLERSSQPGWTRISLPGLIWVNTGVLVLSSITMEIARRSRHRGFLWATVLLGLVFLVGQYAAWAGLREQAIFLRSNPHSSFFYILTGLHGIHILGGLIALAVTRRRPDLLGLAAGFWHFMGLVWLYVLAVLTVL
ncbi:MAG: cytochrome c oxidase subunit 3 [Planctomycetota bacterium]